MSTDMMPVKIVGDAMDGRFADMKPTSQLATFNSMSSQTSDLCNLGIVQLGSTVFVSTGSHLWKNSSTLVLPISVVITDCPQEQVVDVDARRIIARMANTLLRWINTSVNKVRKTMCIPRPFTRFHLAVPLSEFCTEPRPALRWSCFLNVLPKVMQRNWRDSRYGFIFHSGIVH